jgi:tripartite-type tricarboxylate transporter receptor subunit TctC
MQRRHLLETALLGAALLVPGAAFAQAAAWPDKPVKWILSQPPGSGPDNIARMLGEQLSRTLGQPIVIDNKPGGQNVIGAQAAARSTPDGYTFYFATTAALVTNTYLFKSMAYDPQKDFVPVAFIGKSPFAVLVKAESPIQSIQDLIARSKASPGTLSVGNEGPRSFGGIIARLLNARSGANANLVAYSNVGVAVQNVIGGQTDAVVADVASTAQLVRQGRLRMLAVTTGKRIPAWSQVPSLAELIPGFDMSGWFTLVAPTRHTSGGDQSHAQGSERAAGRQGHGRSHPDRRSDRRTAGVAGGRRTIPQRRAPALGRSGQGDRSVAGMMTA